MMYIYTQLSFPYLEQRHADNIIRKDVSKAMIKNKINIILKLENQEAVALLEK